MQSLMIHSPAAKRCRLTLLALAVLVVAGTLPPVSTGQNVTPTAPVESTEPDTPLADPAVPPKVRPEPVLIDDVQQPGREIPQDGREPSDEAERQRRETWLAATLSQVQLVGLFTVDGSPLNDLREERYLIDKVEKSEVEDIWLFYCRIIYGDHDRTVVLPLPVKWAGKTPVITLDSLSIPGMGTFDARVVITEDKYAGTWAHGERGGHLFGRIERQDDTEDIERQEDTDDSE